MSTEQQFLTIEDLIAKGLTTPNRVKRAGEIVLELKEHFGTLFYGEFHEDDGKSHTCSVDIVSGQRECDCRDFKFRRGEIFCAHIVKLLLTVTKNEVTQMIANKQEGEAVVGKIEEFITTGCSDIDMLLGGGLPRRAVTLAYSMYNVGKSILGAQIAASAAYTTNRPSFYIDTEDYFTQSSDRERVLSFFQKRWNKEALPDIRFIFINDVYDLVKYFGKDLILDVSDKEKQITAKLVPTKAPKESPAYLAAKEMNAGILILDSITSPVKDEIPTPPRENFPARAVVLNSILGRLRRVIVDLNIPGYVTSHASKGPGFGKKGESEDDQMAKPYGPAPLGFHIKRMLLVKGDPKSEERTFYRFRAPGLVPLEKKVRLRLNVGFVTYGGDEDVVDVKEESQQ